MNLRQSVIYLVAFALIAVVLCVLGISSSGETIRYRLQVVDSKGEEAFRNIKAIAYTTNLQTEQASTLPIDATAPPHFVTLQVMAPRTSLFHFRLSSRGTIKLTIDLGGPVISKIIAISDLDQWAREHSIWQENKPVILDVP